MRNNLTLILLLFSIINAEIKAAPIPVSGTIPHGVKYSFQTIDYNAHYAWVRLTADALETTKSCLLAGLPSGGFAYFSSGSISVYSLMVGTAACLLNTGGLSVLSEPVTTFSEVIRNLPSMEDVGSGPREAALNMLKKTNISRVYQDSVYIKALSAIAYNAARSMYWQSGFGRDRHIIDDDHHNISQVANITLNIPPPSKSWIQAGIKNMLSMPEFLKSSSNEDKVRELSTKLAYWDIERIQGQSESGWSAFNYLYSTVSSIGTALLSGVGINSGGDSSPFIDDIKKIVGFLKDGQVVRVFFSEYPKGEMIFKFAVLKKDVLQVDGGYESIIESTPLINIPLKSSEDIDSLSDRLAYETESKEDIYSGLGFLPLMANILKSCGIKSEYDQVELSECNPDVSDIAIDFRDETPVHTASVRTVDMFGIPGINLWITNNTYDSNGARSPDIHTSFGEGEWLITSAERQTSFDRDFREQKLLEAVNNKTMNALGKSY